MKIYAKCPDGVKVDYLTAGKLYEVVVEGDGWFELYDDDGYRIIGYWDECAHLGDLDWTRIEVKTSADVLADEAENMVGALREAHDALHSHYVEWDGEPEDAVNLGLARDKIATILARIDEVKE